MRSTRSAAVNVWWTGGRRRAPGRPLMSARCLSISTAPCPTAVPQPRVSSVCIRQPPWVPRESGWTQRICLINQTCRRVHGEGGGLRHMWKPDPEALSRRRSALDSTP